MSAIREAGKINENTTLIDIGMEGIHGMTAVYLIRGDKTCLIDGGTRQQAPRLVQMLKDLGAFPPDIIIATHPHWDHCQAIPWLRREASRRGKKIEVLASQQAVPLLADVTFNDAFNRGPYDSIHDVTPVEDSDTIDLGGITLRIYDVPGHCLGHIAILDEKNRTVFAGDALGIKVRDDIFLPPFMPPTWDADAFQSSVNKLRQISYEALCLAHFGCISGSEAQTILDESLETSRIWWQFFARHAEQLNDTGYLLHAMRQEINPGIPPIRPVSLGMRVLLRLVTAAGSLTGRKTAIIDKLAFGDALNWLATGYRSTH
jgi:glyoxylase-like metal-dependent hydrolase (beta-lactamase superfamily II)